MKEPAETGITISQVKGSLPFISLLIGVVLSWASTKSDLRLLTQQVEANNEILREYVKDTKNIKEEIASLKLEDLSQKKDIEAIIKSTK